MNLYGKRPDGSTKNDWKCVVHPAEKLYGIPFRRIGEPLICYRCNSVPETVVRK